MVAAEEAVAKIEEPVEEEVAVVRPSIIMEVEEVAALKPVAKVTEREQEVVVEEATGTAVTGEAEEEGEDMAVVKDHTMNMVTRRRKVTNKVRGVGRLQMEPHFWTCSMMNFIDECRTNQRIYERIV